MNLFTQFFGRFLGFVYHCFDRIVIQGYLPLLTREEHIETKGLKREDYVRPYGRRMERAHRFGAYFILKSLEQGPMFQSRLPKFPTDDPHCRILKRTRTRGIAAASIRDLGSTSRHFWATSFPSRPRSI